MIRSMTGFVAHTVALTSGELTIEVRTINHRYLDINFRLPEMLRASEMALREVVQQHLKRGRVDVTVRFCALEATQDNMLIDESVLSGLAKNKAIVDNYFAGSQVSFIELMRWPNLIKKQELDTKKVASDSLTALADSLSELIQQREREGATVQTFILESLEAMRQYHAMMQQRWPLICSNSRDKLLSRVAELEASVDPGRFEQEVAFLVQKQDVAEELQRLLVHIDETHRVVTQGGVVGRRLDFLMQELNREANTIASKSADSELTKVALEVKVLIEQIREQVQNIE
jgi:uncharacterized protein (TIGR00255 family)